jgi:hypothetical protein
MAALPALITVAILKHGLYQIDVIIMRRYSSSGPTRSFSAENDGAK